MWFCCSLMPNWSWYGVWQCAKSPLVLFPMMGLQNRYRFPFNPLTLHTNHLPYSSLSLTCKSPVCSKWTTLKGDWSRVLSSILAFSQDIIQLHISCPSDKEEEKSSKDEYENEEKEKKDKTARKMLSRGKFNVYFYQFY